LGYQRWNLDSFGPALNVFSLHPYVQGFLMGDYFRQLLTEAHQQNRLFQLGSRRQGTRQP
jgi:hypothetical protein